MDTSAAAASFRAPARRGPLTPAQRAERAKNGTCFYCDDPGHAIANCPKKPQTRVPPSAVNAATLVPVPDVSGNDHT